MSYQIETVRRLWVHQVEFFDGSPVIEISTEVALIILELALCNEQLILVRETLHVVHHGGRIVDALRLAVNLVGVHKLKKLRDTLERRQARVACR